MSVPQVRVGQPEVLLDGLAPGRDYEVWVRSLRGAETSEAQSIHARTCECPAPRLLPTPAPHNFHGWGSPTPSGSPTSPGHHPPFPHTCGAVPEALVCPAAALGPPRHLSFSDVSHDSARVSWEGTARPVRLFRVSYVSSKSGHSGQVRPGPARGPMSWAVQGHELSTGTQCPQPPPMGTLRSGSVGVAGSPQAQAQPVPGEWRTPDTIPALVGPWGRQM